MAPLVTINRDSTPTILHERSQQRLRELLEQHNRQILSGQDRSVRDPDVLAKSVYQYAKEHDLFRLSLPSAAKSLSTRYSSLPQSVLTAWWERKDFQHSNVPRGKENRPPKHATTTSLSKPAAKRPLAVNTLPSPKPNQSPASPPMRAPKDYRVFPENYHPTPKVSSQPTKQASRKPKLATRTAAVRPPAPLVAPQLSSPAVTPRVSHPPSKRRKYKADAVNPATENARPPTMEAIVPNHDELRTHNTHARAALKEVGQEKQGKAADESAAAKRFLWERMNIFDITEGWESSSAYSGGGPVRQEGEGRFEYLARNGLL
ncbi:hypothetical protein BDZ89DRAFT_478077 [Hymenopellis radicata]|nr:hypothetical protein BDZ89DRAFT_478077 [Hymenopellis radicata]